MRQSVRGNARRGGDSFDIADLALVASTSKYPGRFHVPPITSGAAPDGHQAVFIRAVPSGAFECIEFRRPTSERPFGHRALMIAGALLSDLVVLLPEDSDTVRVDSAGHTNLIASLGRRERQVVQLLVQGFRTKEISAQLGLSPHTINCYLRSIYKKLNVVGRSQLSAWYYQNVHPQDSIPPVVGGITVIRRPDSPNQ